MIREQTGLQLDPLAYTPFLHSSYEVDDHSSASRVILGNRGLMAIYVAINP